MAKWYYTFGKNNRLNGSLASAPLDMGATDIAHSGRDIKVASGIHSLNSAFGDDRIGRKLAAAYDSKTGSVNTTDLGRRSMRRLARYLNAFSDIAQNDANYSTDLYDAEEEAKLYAPAVDYMDLGKAGLRSYDLYLKNHPEDRFGALFSFDRNLIRAQAIEAARLNEAKSLPVIDQSEQSGLTTPISLTTPTEPPISTITKDDAYYNDLVKKVMAGKFGNGANRRNALGEDYTEVQKRVNALFKPVIKNDDSGDAGNSDSKNENNGSSETEHSKKNPDPRYRNVPDTPNEGQNKTVNTNTWDGFKYSGEGEWWKAHKVDGKKYYADAAGNQFNLKNGASNIDDANNRQYGGFGIVSRMANPATNHLRQSRYEFDAWYDKQHYFTNGEVMNDTYRTKRNLAYEGWLKQTTGKNSWEQFKNGGMITIHRMGGTVVPLRFQNGGAANAQNLMILKFTLDLGVCLGAKTLQDAITKGTAAIKQLGKNAQLLFAKWAEAEQSEPGTGQLVIAEVLSAGQQQALRAGSMNGAPGAAYARFGTKLQNKVDIFNIGGCVKCRKGTLLNLVNDLNIEKIRPRFEKCGGKTKKKEAGGTINTAWLANAATTNKGKKMIKTDKCGGKTKKH